MWHTYNCCVRLNASEWKVDKKDTYKYIWLIYYMEYTLYYIKKRFYEPGSAAKFWKCCAFDSINGVFFFNIQSAVDFWTKSSHSLSIETAETTKNDGNEWQIITGFYSGVFWVYCKMQSSWLKKMICEKDVCQSNTLRHYSYAIIWRSVFFFVESELPLNFGISLKHDDYIIFLRTFRTRFAYAFGSWQIEFNSGKQLPNIL